MIGTGLLVTYMMGASIGPDGPDDQFISGLAIVYLFLTTVFISLGVSYYDSAWLVIDERGLAYRDPYPWRLTLFPWSEIETITPDSLLWSKGVHLKMHNPENFRQSLPFSIAFIFKIRKSIWGREYWVPTSSMEVDSNQVLALIMSEFEHHKETSNQV